MIMYVWMFDTRYDIREREREREKQEKFHFVS